MQLTSTIKTVSFVAASLFSLTLSAQTIAQTTAKNSVASTYQGKGAISQGIGKVTGDFSATTTCATGARFVAATSGSVTALDGSQWVVPMQVTESTIATDMYNNCNGPGDNPDFEKQLKTKVIDEDGEVITAYLFGDNYYELYVNGEFVARDSIAFVPFNSTVVRFKVKYPMTIAVHMADWETHPGVGMEYGSFNVGDAGFIAYFDNGTVTNKDWKVLPLYVAPLDNFECLRENENGIPDASACPIRPECANKDPNTCYALHYSVPENWQQPNFDDSTWLSATLYDADAVTRAPGYANYKQVFKNAQFIWSPSLKLDNQVLARFVIQKP